MKVLIKNSEVIVDESDLFLIDSYNWQCAQYIMTHVKRKPIYLHRVIMNAKKGQIVDHKDGNKYNNSRSNLRICTPSQNNANHIVKKTRKDTKIASVYRGVYWRKDTAKWRSEIQFQGNRQYLGSFSNEVEAAIAYNNAAELVFGDFASLNKVVN
jgi:hypothetical protein